MLKTRYLPVNEQRLWHPLGNGYLSANLKRPRTAILLSGSRSPNDNIGSSLIGFVPVERPTCAHFPVQTILIPQLPTKRATPPPLELAGCVERSDPLRD